MHNQRKDDDNRLNSGERQVQSVFSKIDYWHTWRYNEALKYISSNDVVIDAGCGCGYGTMKLASKCKFAIGIDDCKEAINYANKYWITKNNCFYMQNILDVQLSSRVVVAFEIIEHLKDYAEFIEQLKENVQHRIIFSVPHNSVPLSRSKWHWKHFSESEMVYHFTDGRWNIERLELIKDCKTPFIFGVAKSS